MGREVLHTLDTTPDLTPVGGVDIQIADSSLLLANGGSLPLFTDIQEAIQVTQPQVMVDFTTASSSIIAAQHAIPFKVHQVIGTTGLNSKDLGSLDALAQEHGVGVIVAPNFALGAGASIVAMGSIPLVINHWKHIGFAANLYCESSEN